MKVSVSKISNFVFLSVLLLMVFSCTKPPVYFKYQNVEDSAWHMDSVLTFQTVNMDTLNVYQMDVYLRHGLKYAYKNLWLQLDVQSPEGMLVSKKIELQLTDKEGFWKGTSISSLVDYKAVLDNHLVLSDTGTYTWRFSHLMSDTVLYEISDVGMSLSKLK